MFETNSKLGINKYHMPFRTKRYTRYYFGEEGLFFVPQNLREAPSREFNVLHSPNVAVIAFLGFSTLEVRLNDIMYQWYIFITPTHYRENY